MTDRISVTYNYRHDRYSANAIRHTMRYISAVSAVDFVWDETAPALSNDPEFVSSKYHIKNDCDEIARITAQLAFSYRMGPFSNEKHKPSDDALLSENISSLISHLKRAGLIPESWPAVSLWPGKGNYCVAVTHDVDILRRTILGGLRLWINGHLPGGLKAVADSIKWRLGFGSNPYDCFAKWWQLEDSRGLKSTYFIFAGARQHNYDPVYELSWIPFDKIPGREIALHSSIGCYMGQGLCEPKNQLELKSNSPIRGLRPHYLSAFMPEYWQAAFDSGFEYSSSLGFDDAIGFVRGIDLPFYPFDLGADRHIPILEIPIAIMDCGLIGPSDALSDKTAASGIRLMERSAKSGGLIVLDWHQRTLYNPDYPGWGALFEKLIDFAVASDANFMSLEEINSLMRSRFDAAR